MSPQITVLMSVYNGRPFLNRAIESILNQTFEQFEFIIVDDASSDGSSEIVKEWGERDDRIRIITNETNQGLGYCLDLGVKEAQAPLIARMDDDDISLPRRLEKQVAYLKDHSEVDVLSSWAIDCDANENPIRIRQCPTTHEDIRRLIWTIPFIHPAVIFKRDAILKAGSYDPSLRRRQDYDLWFRCAAAGLQFANIAEPLILYRFTGDYYRKNDWRVAYDQARIGWRGCKLVGAGPVAYLGVMAPLVRALLPGPVQKLIHRVMNRFDPRRLVDVVPDEVVVERQYQP